MFVHISASTQRSQKKVLGPLGLELQIAASLLIWVLRIKLCKGPLQEQRILLTAEL